MGTLHVGFPCHSCLQLLLVMWVLEHSSVFLLCCWVTVVPLLLGASRAADVARTRWLLPESGKQLPWLAAAAVGLGETMLAGLAMVCVAQRLQRHTPQGAHDVLSHCWSSLQCTKRS